MKTDPRRLLLPLAICALTAGCGSSTRLSHRRSANRCPRPSSQGWQFGPVHFLSARVGVGISPSRSSCAIPSGSGAMLWRGPVRLAVTRDGGRSWRAYGAELPVASSASHPVLEQLLAASTRNVYVLTGNGAVLRTSNAGRSWARQLLPGPVLQLVMNGGTIWALACPTAPNHATAPALAGLRFCQPVLERTTAVSGTWTRVRLPAVAHVLDVQLAAASKDVQVLELDHPGGGRGELLYTLDGGLRWSSERGPSWDRLPCPGSGMFAAAAPHTWWILCLGDAAAGSSTKGLLRTTDYGRTWATVSQVRSLLAPASTDSTSISREEPDAFAAGSSTRLWLVYQNSMGESSAAGARWVNVPGVNPQGVPASFDVLDGTHAWLAIPGQGLWRTTDGSRWTLAAALYPCSSSQLSLKSGPPISEPTEQSTRLLVLRNVSPSACRLNGYPAVALLDAHGGRLALRYRDGGDQLLTRRPPRSVTLAPLDEAYLAINKNACVGRDSMIATRIRVTLPHARGSLTTTVARYPLLDYCPAGDPGHVLDISPFEPAPSGAFT